MHVLPLILILGLAGPAPTTRGPVVVTTLSPQGAAALALELEKVAPGAFTVEAVRDLDEIARILRRPDPPAVALYGVALPQLEELRLLEGIPEFDPFQDGEFEPSPADPPDRAYLPVFADCVVVAIDRLRAEADLGRGVDTMLPSRPSDLASGKFEHGFFAPTPDLDNATGAWIGRIALTDPDDTEDLLAALGANLAGGETPNDGAALERVRAEGPPAFAVVCESSLRREAGGTSLEGLRTFGASLSVVRGFAWFKTSDPTRHQLVAILAPESLARVAAAERFTSLRGPEEELSDADLTVRRAVEMEGPRVGFATARIREWVPRYRGELRERLGKRRQRFEDFYDVAFLVALAIAGGWLLLRRKPADDPPRRNRADR